MVHIAIKDSKYYLNLVSTVMSQHQNKLHYTSFVRYVHMLHSLALLVLLKHLVLVGMHVYNKEKKQKLCVRTLSDSCVH